MRVVAAAVLALSTVPARADVPAAPARPALELASEDEQSAIRLRLIAQLRWDGVRRDTGDGGAAGFYLYVRRVRPIITGHLFGDRFTYFLHLSTAPDALELVELFADYRFHEQARLRLGQMKVPFTRWRTNSCLDRPTTDWTYPTKYFGSERQLGVMVHNDTRGPAGFEYQVGVYDGVNARASNGVGMATVYGEVIRSPSNLVDPAPREDLHAEGFVHVAYNAGGIDVTRPTDFTGGALRWSAGISGAWDIDPTPKHDMRLRIAPEAEVKWNHFAATGVLYLGFFDPVMTNGSHELGLVGGLVQTSYLMMENFEIALKLSAVRVLPGLRDDARDAGNAVIATGGFTDNLEIQYAGVGALRAENELDLTFNLFALGGALKLQAEGALIIHERRFGNRYDYALRLQGQLAF